MNFKNNLALAFRHLKSDKINSLINLSGLVLSLGIVAVVIVFILNELGYNQSFANSNQIFRVLNYSNSEDKTWGNTPFVLGETLPHNFPEVEECVHQYNISDIEVKSENNFISEDEMLCTNSNFFKVFGVQIMKGGLDDFNQSSGKILISNAIAQKYFKTTNPVGKNMTLRFMGVEYPMEVTAVYNDLPKNVTIKASMIANMDFAMEHLKNNLISTEETPPDIQRLKESWNSGIFFTNYILLKKETNIGDFENKLHQYGSNLNIDDLQLSFSLQPLSDIYFGSGNIVDNNSIEHGNLSMLYILALIGFLILIIACINYLNLTSARAFTKTRTFAVQKICGAPKGTLISQMMLESILISIIALPFALLLANIALPYISTLLGKSYELTFQRNLWISLGILCMITISTGLLTGLIISLRIASFNLVDILKGSNKPVGSKHTMRKALVVFQMAVFIILFAVMTLVQRQIDYAFTKDIGFVKEGLLRIPLGDHNYELFKQQLNNEANILSISGALWIPPHKGKMIMTIPKVNEPENNVNIYGDFVDYGFAKTMGMEIIKGDDFTIGQHNSGVLINKTAIETLGLTDIIGEQTAFGPVVGVVSDFNMYSIHEDIPPMIIGLSPEMCREIAIRINTSDIRSTISLIQDKWKLTGGTTPFDFDFTDDILNQLYDSDLRFSKTIGLMAFIAIFIASLGLFGLSLHISKQKTKEIGIRKVNGAKISEVLIILNKDFIKWVAIAFVIATPISWYAMTKWLENFAFKTDLSWWIYAISGMLALGITLLTVSWQCWIAATRNPVEALRHE